MLSESSAIRDAATRLAGSFTQAVKLLAGCDGKVVVTGIGKSGHIGRKIASTMTSTGTSAMYLHPAEALHGDLGVIESRDILIAIAFGGETKEVLDVVGYCRRNRIPVIGICGNPASSLGKLATLFLDGSVEKEACYLNLAPSSSSSVALAIGDALALSTMQLKGFKDEDFANFHPGGRLGVKLTRVSEVMRQDLRFIRHDATLNEVLESFTGRNYGIVVVLDTDSQLVGAITDGDLRRAMIKDKSLLFSKSAKDLMTAAPKVISVDEMVLVGVEIMEKKSVTSLFVVESRGSQKVVGLLRMHDLLSAKII